MNETKPWWQSRTIWTGLLGGLYAILSIFKILPEGLEQEMVLEAVLGVTSVLAVLFRAKATKEVTAI